MSTVLAIVIGALFGFALNRVGATNPQNIINMMRLTDTHLMKTILLAIGFSSLLLFLGMSFGVIDVGHLSVKSMYLGVLIGGGLLGLGFAIAGYCPGTGLTAFASGRKDALPFIIGGLVGAFVFTLMYGGLKEAFPGLFAHMFGGEATLVPTGSGKYPAILDVPGTMVAAVIAVIFMGIAYILPHRLR